MTGVIFDFNGTMLFDEKFQELSWRSFIGEKAGREITDTEFQEYIHGRNADVSLPYFLKRDLSREEVIKLEEEKEKIYRDLCLQSEDFRLADGLPKFLDLLKKRDVPMTIATASGWNNVEFFFDHLGLGKWFPIHKVVYNDGTVPGKPEPDLYLLAADKLQKDIRDCVVFEDSISGIESAKRAGAKTIIKVDSMAQSRMSDDVAGSIKNYCDIDMLLEYVGMGV
ncbi:MAG: HAD family phosphatase [Lachnospiraceae bacterium]|nr:HAD family phosphatase [Lachnospiraceae bacterium]